MYGSNGATNPPPTNNPFIENSSHPSNRYPDLSAPPTQPQWTDHTAATLLTGAPQQYQPDIYQQYPPALQQQIPTGYSQQPPPPPQFQVPQQQLGLGQQVSQQPQNYSPYQQSQLQPQPTASFQPTSAFGQSLQSSISGGPPGGYGYPQSHQPPSQQTSAYNPVQQQLLNNPNYVGQLDPYAPISQGWAAADTVTAAAPQSQSLGPDNSSSNVFGYGNNNLNNNNQINSGPGVGFSPSGDPHPRDYIRSHRQEIEAWDPYTWKQLLNSCESLKRSWESRRNELKNKLARVQSQLGFIGYYDRSQIQQEVGRMQGLLNEAQSNFDSASVSMFQFDESFKGYRQSGDTFSKKRVREATNAALQRLPKWPEP